MTDHEATLSALLMRDPLRRAALAQVAALAPGDGWIGAGFIRDAVWDHLHGYGVCPPHGDIDVLRFDPALDQEAADRCLEEELMRRLPQLAWSVKNQARMHRRNHDAPYADVADAMRHWPETATAVAVRMDASGGLTINAPFGLDDLFGLRVVPTPVCRGAGRLSIFDARVAAKRWIQRYPRLIVAVT